jgi:hypothetical protein
MHEVGVADSVVWLGRAHQASESFLVAFEPGLPPLAFLSLASVWANFERARIAGPFQ